MKPENTVTIIPFSDELKDAIKTLNEEWLLRYFKLEPRDIAVLSNPRKFILDQGGKIFYAQYNNAVVGTVSLIKVSNTDYELSKMAVTDGVQGLGIGKKMIDHCIEEAQAMQLKKLILYSNTKLETAIHLYKKYGFVEVPLENNIYERSDIKMERIIEKV